MADSEKLVIFYKNTFKKENITLVYVVLKKHNNFQIKNLYKTS